MPRRTERPIVSPRERAIDDRRERRKRRAIAIVERRVVLSELEAEQRFLPAGRSPNDFL